jgi:hypothetical protein
VAPIPNMMYAHRDPDQGREVGYFMTSFFVVSGLALPFVLNHSKVISDHSAILSVCGGLLIYVTILAYVKFFTQPAVYI